MENNPREKRMEEILESLRVDSPSALDDLREFAAAHPDYPDAWAHLAWNLNGRGHIREAFETATHLIGLLPESPDAHRLLARTAFQQGHTESSLRSMRQAVRLSGTPFPIRLEMVEIMLHLGRPFSSMLELIRLYRQRSAERPIPSRFVQKVLVHAALNLFARILCVPWLRKKFFSRAYSYFTEREAFGKASIIANCAASVHSADGVWTERAADTLYRERDYLHPEFEEEIAWRNAACRSGVPHSTGKLARAHLHAGHALAAVSILEDARDLSNGDRTVFAHALASVGRHRDATELYSRLGPHDPMQYVNAGIVCLLSDDFHSAIPCFEKAVEAEPSHPMAVFLYSASSRRARGETFTGLQLDTILQELSEKNGWQESIGETRNDWEEHSQRLLKSGRYHLIDCPNCGSKRFQPTYFDLVPGWVRGRCNDCGFLFANPQPLQETIGDLYMNESVQGNLLHRFFRQMLDEIQAQPPDEAGKMFGRKERWWEPEFSLPEFEAERGDSRRMLDVGCSVGTLMYQYQCRGWQVSGIDLDDNAVRLAQSIGLDARTVTLEAVDYSPGSFDFIAMMDVIEHVPDHKPLVRKLYSLLKPGGILKLKTPCPESIVHYQYGPQWISSYNHLLYFSRRILTDCLVQAGFEIVATRSYMEANKITHTYSGWRRLSVTPSFDPLANDWDIGDTHLVLAKKN